MLFKCPVCQQMHSVPDNYDRSDYICQNTSTGRNPKTFQDMTPNDLMSRSRPNFNKHSTKSDVIRPVTVIVPKKPGYSSTGEKVGELQKNY